MSQNDTHYSAWAPGKQKARSVVEIVPGSVQLQICEHLLDKRSNGCANLSHPLGVVQDPLFAWIIQKVAQPLEKVGLHQDTWSDDGIGGFSCQQGPGGGAQGWPEVHVGVHWSNTLNVDDPTILEGGTLAHTLFAFDHSDPVLGAQLVGSGQADDSGPDNNYRPFAWVRHFLADTLKW